MVKIQSFIDDVKYFETIRLMRWPCGVRCTECGSTGVTKDGRDEALPERQRYKCHGRGKRFDKPDRDELRPATLRAGTASHTP